MTDGMGRRVCPECGTPLAPTDTICPGCGAEVTAAPSPVAAPTTPAIATPAAVERAEVKSATGPFCTTCGQPIPAGARFCPHCGAAQPPGTAPGGRRLKSTEPARRGLPTGWWMLPLALVVAVVSYWLLRRPTPVVPTEAPAAATAPPAATAQLAEMQALYDGARTPEARRELGTQLSDLYIQADRFADAARVLSELARTTPEAEAPAVWLKVANLYHDAGDNLEAIAAYEEVLRRTPDNVDARVDMGTCYYRLRRYDEARAAMLEGIRRQPTHQIAHLNLGVIETARGESAAGRVALQRAVELDPNSPAGRQAKTLLDSPPTGPSS